MKTSNYFQKRAIVLVGAMLLTITNLKVAMAMPKNPALITGRSIFA